MKIVKINLRRPSLVSPHRYDNHLCPMPRAIICSLSKLRDGLVGNNLLLIKLQNLTGRCNAFGFPSSYLRRMCLFFFRYSPSFVNFSEGFFGKGSSQKTQRSTDMGILKLS